VTTARKNLFLIARKGHEGDENQLTEMLAWLLEQVPELGPLWLADLGYPIDEITEWYVETQRAVPGGFIDLVLFAPGQALVIVESKLGSTTDFAQIEKYVKYAKSVTLSGEKCLIFMTQNPEPWPIGVQNVAGDEVRLVLCRWQALGTFLYASTNQLAQDFAAMLAREGLLKPEAITTDDWEAWQRGSDVTRRLAKLLEEIVSDVQALERGCVKAGSVTLSNNGLLYRLFHFEELSCGLAFWPTRNPIKPTDHAMVVVYLLNTAIPAAERKAAGQAAVERAASSQVAMSGWSEYYIQRSTPAHNVLTETTFDAQLQQLVDHLRRDLSYFRDIDYLKLPAPAGLETI
jgi:hypothetical protein